MKLLLKVKTKYNQYVKSQESAIFQYMADDESNPEALGFLSDFDVEDIFEVQNVFKDELETQTFARLDWMLTKHRAAFLVLAYELGIDPVTAAKLSTAQVFLSQIFSEFISTGIDAEFDAPPLHHPLDEAFNDLVDEIVEPTARDAVDNLSPVQMLMNDLVNGTDENLLHRLDRIRKTINN